MRLSKVSWQHAHPPFHGLALYAVEPKYGALRPHRPDSPKVAVNRDGGRQSKHACDDTVKCHLTECNAAEPQPLEQQDRAEQENNLEPEDDGSESHEANRAAERSGTGGREEGKVIGEGKSDCEFKVCV